MNSHQFCSSSEILCLAPSVGKYNYKKVSFKKGGACLMDYKLLETATKDFQESNILGQGGFGCIYKARLDDNFHVAVKRLSGGSQDAITEFEVTICFLNFFFPFIFKEEALW